MVQHNEARVTVTRVPANLPAALTRRCKLLRFSSQAKLDKAFEESGGLVITGGLSLLPADSIAGTNACPGSTPACRALCLNKSGQGGIPKAEDTVGLARYRKARAYWHDREAFTAQLRADFEAVRAFQARYNVTVKVRLNVLSDVDFRAVIREFPEVQCYDYTKVLARYRANQTAPVPNYRLTFSRSERNEAACLEVLASGGTVAVPFGVAGKRPLPATWHGYPVVDGDTTDDRTLDAPGTVIGLRYKKTWADVEAIRALGIAWEPKRVFKGRALLPLSVAVQTGFVVAV